MPDIPINNETEYTLTPSLLEQIQRDALEYFSDAVRSIRVQYGIDRHAFNAKTGEMRYAFSPGDFGLVDMKASFPEPYQSRHVIPSIDDEEEVSEASFEDVGIEEEEEAAPAFESLDEEIEDVEDGEEADFQSLEEDFEEIEDEEKDFLYDDDEYA